MDHVYQLYLSFLHQRLTNGEGGGKGRGEKREGGRGGGKGREGGVDGKTILGRQRWVGEVNNNDE